MASYPTRKKHRANREGSIYKDRGRWRVALTWTDTAGIRQRRTASAPTQAQARLKLAALRAELDKGLEPPKAQTVGDYLAGWLEHERERGGIRPSTWRQYEQHVRTHVVPALGRIELTKLVGADVERMTTAMVKNGSAPRTAQLARTILRRALADAQRDEKVHRNAAALARSPRVPGRSIKPGRDYFEGPDLRRLIVAAKVHPVGPLVTLAATTALRLGELLGLTWADIDTDARTLTVRRALARSWDGGWALSEPKTERSVRTINIAAAAIVALDRQRDLQQAAHDAVGRAWQDRDGLIFTDAVGRPTDGRAVNKTFHTLLEAAGLPAIPFHGLRHSAATAMLAGGVSMRTVADALGHSTIVVTADTYAHVSPEAKREAADAIDRALGGES